MVTAWARRINYRLDEYGVSLKGPDSRRKMERKEKREETVGRDTSKSKRK